MNRTHFAAVALSLALSHSAFADIIHFDVNAPSVVFTSISEGSPTGDPLPLYNQPIGNGDELVFSPTAAYSATSAGGGASDQTDGKLFVTIAAKPGFSIAELDIAESGLATLNAPFGGDAFASVMAYSELKILEVGGAPVVSPTTMHFFSVTPDSSFLHSADATGPTFASPWAGQLSLTLPNDVTKLLLVVNNQFFASTIGVGTGAIINKNLLTIQVTSDPIPEPSTALLAIACVTCCRMARRRAYAVR